MIESEQLPWRYFLTKPIPVRAVENGVDIDVDGIPTGDFLIENPDPLDAMEAPILHCPRENFIGHYQEVVPDGNETSEEIDTEEGEAGQAAG